MFYVHTISDAQQAPRPASPLQEARVLIYRPSYADIFSLDKTRLSLPSLTREVSRPTRSDIASLMAETFDFFLSAERYHQLEQTLSTQGTQLSYYLAALGQEERMPRGISLSLVSIRNCLYPADSDDYRCLMKNFVSRSSSSNLC